MIMEKTYRFTLPQNKEVKSTNVRVENGEVLVGVEFKDEFKPKGGDVIVAKNGSILLYNGWNSSHFYFGFAILCENQDSIVVDDRVTYLKVSEKECRYATSEEKAAFLKRLEKECHKRWNPETKQLEDIRWRVEKDGCFFYVSGETFNVLKLYDNRGKVSDLLYKNSNYFKTPESAQKVADKIKEIFRNSKAE